MYSSNRKNTVMRIIYVSIAVLGFAFSAIAEDKKSSAIEHKIDIRSFLYDPDPIYAKEGDTITWTNHDIVPHTATVTKTGIGTGDIPALKSRSITVEEPGSLTYICRYHANMHGVINVQ